MKILILTGGASPERDVSLVSASKIAKALINKGHSVYILDLLFGINDLSSIKFTNLLSDIPEYQVKQDATLLMDDCKCQIGTNIVESCKLADVVFLALHGDIGENGKIQSLLELYKIKHTGSNYSSCLLTMDKHLAKTIVAYNNINTAKWCINQNNKKIKYPCVIKPVNGGSSLGVSIVNNDYEKDLALKLSSKYDCNIMIEELIEGREFSVGVLNNKPLPVIEIEPKNGFYDYKNKYQAGLTIETCPAVLSKGLTEKMQNIALEIHNLFNLNYYSRTDFILDKNNNIYFLEVNTLPGMTQTSLLPQEAFAQGISYEDLCDGIVKNAI